LFHQISLKRSVEQASGAVGVCSQVCLVFSDFHRCPDEDFNEILKPKLAANIEKARIAMSRLEEIFTQNPSLQTTSVMRQLLDVYKDCRLVSLEQFIRNNNSTHKRDKKCLQNFGQKT
jgi:hypothetical protein